MTNGQPHIEFRDLSAFYGSKQVLKNLSFAIPRNSVIGIIGPANSGKTTLLKTINRTLDFIGGARVTGDVLIEGQSLREMRNPNELRRRIGVVGDGLAAHSPRAAWGSRTRPNWTPSSSDAFVKPCYGTK